MEVALVALLKTRCPRVLIDGSAPVATPKPYVLWQLLGGPSLRYTEGTAMSKRMQMVQVTVWDVNALNALTLLRTLEDDLCATGVFVAECMGEPTPLIEPDLQPIEYGFTQDFRILADR
jgi:hypothetical protein